MPEVAVEVLFCLTDSQIAHCFSLFGLHILSWLLPMINEMNL